jgi:predicted permease
MGESASGVMLLVLGMAIKPTALAGSLGKFGTWWPMFGLSPVIVACAGTAIDLSALHLHATTLEAAMPSQLFICIIAGSARLRHRVAGPGSRLSHRL